MSALLCMQAYYYVQGQGKGVVFKRMEEGAVALVKNLMIIVLSKDVIYRSPRGN